MDYRKLLAGYKANQNDLKITEYIDHFVQKISETTIDNISLNSKQRQSFFEEIYSILLYSGIYIYPFDVHRMVFFNESSAEVAPMYQKTIHNIRRFLEYVYNYYSKSEATIDEKYFRSVNFNVAKDIYPIMEIGEYAKNISEDDKHILVDSLSSDNHIINAGLFLYLMYNMSPFAYFNEFTSSLTVLMYLYKNGYSLLNCNCVFRNCVANTGKLRSLLKKQNSISNFVSFFLDCQLQEIKDVYNYYQAPSISAKSSFLDISLSDSEIEIVQKIKNDGLLGKIESDDDKISIRKLVKLGVVKVTKTRKYILKRYPKELIH